MSSLKALRTLRGTTSQQRRDSLDGRSAHIRGELCAIQLLYPSAVPSSHFTPADSRIVVSRRRTGSSSLAKEALHRCLAAPDWGPAQVSVVSFASTATGARVGITHLLPMFRMSSVF